MSLLSDRMEKFVKMTPVYTDDSEGGKTTTWNDGATFNAALTFKSSEANTEASRETVKDLYSVTTDRNTALTFHDVFKRSYDNLILRVVSNGDENKTPTSAQINMRQVIAERWVLT